MKRTPNLLFITRKYPPMVGGMEKLSFALGKEFSELLNTTIISWGYSQKYLPIVLPYFLLRAIYEIYTKKNLHLHLGDALLSPLGVLLKAIFRIKVTVTVVGLDVTFNSPGYQFIIIRCLKQMDKIVCISTATKKECVKRGISPKTCLVVPCGVYMNEFRMNTSRKDLEQIVGRKLVNKKVLVTVGRLVKRKGVCWFIENVFPKLGPNTVYIVIGKGPEANRIKKLIKKKKMENQIFLLGQISDKELKIVYNTVDFFIMPNITVKENIEGFGIVAVEASSVGLPVIANNIEGISDAVINNRTGLLVDANNPNNFINAIKKCSLPKTEIIKTTSQYFSWRVIGEKYINAFYQLYER